MWPRVLSRLALLAGGQAVLGVLLGWWLGWPAALLAVVLFGLLLAGLDAWRAGLFIDWVREGELPEAPRLRGPWGEAVYRTVRRLRTLMQQRNASEQRLTDFLAAIQASPNGVLLLDAQGRIEWCNDIAGEHFGIDPRRDVLQHIGNLVREPAFAAYFAGKDYRAEVQLLGRQNMPAHPVKLAVQLARYGEGQLLMLSRDVTALAQADAMRRDFVANVSHEIRTPLTVLAGFVETLQQLPLTEPERQRYLAMMAEQSERMQLLVNDLLMLSRLEGSPPPDLRSAVDLGELTARCENEARALSLLLHPPGERPQTLRVGPAPDFALAGAEGELRSAIANLINNAVRYTPGGGRIDVAWERLPGGGARLAVTDTGPGIQPEHLPRLGERFYRVDRSRARESGGTGLGLAIAKHVAQRHGGELQVSSAVGKGSCFALVFPASRVLPSAHHRQGAGALAAG